jgi:hypothetical protein
MMNRLFIVCITVLGALASLGCPEPARAASETAGDACKGLQEWGLFVNGESADDFVDRLRRDDDREEIFLHNPPPDGLGIEGTTDALDQRLRQIDREPTSVIPNVPQALQGISGFITTLVLKKLRLQVHPVLSGKIRDYIFDERTKSGHLSVDVCIDRNQFFHWDIEVLDGEYRIHQRISKNPQNPNYPDHPFPNVDLTLPAAATDPNDPNSVWVRNLDHKLHAMGNRIQVRHIYHRGPTAPDLMRLDSRHHLYTSTRESCIDLFTEGYPPATVGELKQKDFCLGRCAHPAIVNTGGG